MTAIEGNLVSVEGGVDSAGDRQYTKIYRVITDRVTDGPIAASNYRIIPRWGDSYNQDGEQDVFAICTDIRARLEKVEASRKVWLVTANYTTLSVDVGGVTYNRQGQQITHPLYMPVRWSGSFVQFQKEVTEDYKGNAINNTAGDRIQGLTKDDSRPELVAEKNLARLELAKWMEYRDSVNKDSIWGLNKETIKVEQIGWQPMRWGKYGYWKVTYRFLINPDGWREQVPNVGMRARTAVGGAVKVVLDDDTKHPIYEPVYLDENGLLLSVTKPDVERSWVTKLFYKRKPFAALGLPRKIEVE